MATERVYKPVSGWGPLTITLLMLFGSPVAIVGGAAMADAGTNVAFGVVLVTANILSAIAGLLMLFGFQAVAPNDARVMPLLGEYRGSVVESGFYWLKEIAEEYPEVMTRPPGIGGEAVEVGPSL